MFIYWRLFDRIHFWLFCETATYTISSPINWLWHSSSGEIFYSNSFHFNIWFGYDTAYFFFYHWFRTISIHLFLKNNGCVDIPVFISI